MTDLIKRLRALQGILPEPDPFEIWRDATGLALVAADEIERLRERAEAAAESWNALQRALKEIERQSGVIRNLNGQCDRLGIKLGEVIRERDALRANADRYRWLRENDWSKRGLCVVANSESVKLGHDCLSHERLDAAIDAARREWSA